MIAASVESARVRKSFCARVREQKSRSGHFPLVMGMIRIMIRISLESCRVTVGGTQVSSQRLKSCDGHIRQLEALCYGHGGWQTAVTLGRSGSGISLTAWTFFAWFHPSPFPGIRLGLDLRWIRIRFISQKVSKTLRFAALMTRFRFNFW